MPSIIIISTLTYVCRNLAKRLELLASARPQYPEVSSAGPITTSHWRDHGPPRASIRLGTSSMDAKQGRQTHTWALATKTSWKQIKKGNKGGQSSSVFLLTRRLVSDSRYVMLAPRGFIMSRQKWSRYHIRTLLFLGTYFLCLSRLCCRGVGWVEEKKRGGGFHRMTVLLLLLLLFKRTQDLSDCLTVCLSVRLPVCAYLHTWHDYWRPRWK